VESWENFCGMIGKVVYKKIKEAIPYRDIRTVADLSRHTGIPLPTIYGWRYSKGAFDRAQLNAVINALQVTEAYLFGEQSLSDARSEYQRRISYTLPKVKHLPLVRHAEDVVELSIHLLSRKEWKGEMVEMPEDVWGDAVFILEDESMLPVLLPGTRCAFRKQSEAPIHELVLLQKEDGSLCVRFSELRGEKLMFVPLNQKYLTYSSDEVKVVGVLTAVHHADIQRLNWYVQRLTTQESVSHL